MKELVEIQRDLKAPKNMYNEFGKYKYRSCESILEAAKPIYTALGCYVKLTDEIIFREDAPDLLVATVTIVNNEKEFVQAKAYGAIDYDKKGMDPSQAIGAASSYARKYALNGLFAIDDTKDADATNTHGKEEPTTVKESVPAVNEDIEHAIQCCTTTAELQQLWSDNPDWVKDKAIIALVNRRKKELNKS